MENDTMLELLLAREEDIRKLASLRKIRIKRKDIDKCLHLWYNIAINGGFCL